MPDRWGAHLRDYFFDSAQEKGSGVNWTVAGHGCNAFRGIKRADQPEPGQWAGHRPGLVFAGFISDGTHLRATGETLAAVSRTRHFQEAVGFGCGVFHVHSFPYPDIVVPGFIAGYASRQVSGRSGPSTLDRSNAVGFTVLSGGCSG